MVCLVGCSATAEMLLHHACKVRSDRHIAVLGPPATEPVGPCDSDLTERIDGAVELAAEHGWELDMVILDASWCSADVQRACCPSDVFEHHSMAMATELVVLFNTSDDVISHPKKTHSDISTYMRCADRIVVSGASALDDAQLTEILAAIHGINPEAFVVMAEDRDAALGLPYEN